MTELINQLIALFLPVSIIIFSIKNKKLEKEIKNQKYNEEFEDLQR